jgi:hypothetical protein
VPLLVDEDVALGVGEAEELLEDGIDAVDVVLVEDEPFLADIVAVGDDGPPPEPLWEALVNVHTFLSQ